MNATTIWRRCAASPAWSGAGQARRLAMIIKWGKLDARRKVGRVLDNGCGVGMYIKALAPFADALFGNEIEPEHLEFAARTVPHAHLQYAVRASALSRQLF
ncbi:MAG: hypothetical protein R3A44_26290 [Caldilineaceae bacterium]